MTNYNSIYFVLKKRKYRKSLCFGGNYSKSIEIVNNKFTFDYADAYKYVDNCISLNKDEYFVVESILTNDRMFYDKCDVYIFADFTNDCYKVFPTLNDAEKLYCSDCDIFHLKVKAVADQVGSLKPLN